MSVNSLDNKVICIGGDTNDYPFDFKVFAASDLIVERFTIADGTVAAGVLNTHYSVTITGSSGGTVTMIGDWEDSTADYKIIIRRVPPLTQLSSFVDNESTPAATFEEGYDRLVMITQSLQEQLDRAVMFNSAGGDTDLTNAIATALEVVLASLAGLEKCTTAEAQIGAEDANYSTPAKVKAQIEYAGNLKGSALTGLASVPAGAGELPAANVADIPLTTGVTGVLPAANGGTGSSAAANAASGVVVLDASSKLPAVDGRQLTVVKKAQLFEANGTWTAPAGVTKVYLTLQGGGGSGGAGEAGAHGGGGGGAGAMILQYAYTVVPTTGYAVVVGAKAIGVTDSDGQDGVASTFDTTVSAAGGAKGVSASGAGGAGGSLGIAVASGATAGVNHFGLAGQSGSNYSGTSGGGGGSSAFGAGGNGNDSDTNPGYSATGYGGGGGGGGFRGSGHNKGGDGSAGFVLVEWI